MKHYKSVKLLLTAYSFFLAGTLCSGVRKATFRDPVTDVFFEKLSTIYDYKKSLDELYSSCPLFATTAWGCRRAIQCLYNEVVEVVTESDEEVCITVPHVFYNTIDRSACCNTFWTLKSNLLMFDDAAMAAVDFSAFPPVIDRKDRDSVAAENVLVLTMPWHDAVTARTYSVGTRFVRVPEEDTEWFYAVRFFDTENLKEVKTFIVKQVATVFEMKSQKERQKDFVQLIKRWADASHGTVPYVWGGCSLTGFLPDDGFDHMHAKFAGKLVALWAHRDSMPPHSGMDCSLLILRAAQICGIPYFFKNSYTISKYMRPLAHGEDLEEGDIIWYDGHVIVISDIKNNKIIESCGYPFGFGKLQEIEISKRLVGIETYEDLLREYYNHEFIGSLDSDGVVRRILERFEIFKFSSVWSMRNFDFEGLK